MTRWLWPCLTIGGLVGLLFLFHIWGVEAREREWWWTGGGPDHMTFLDLADQKGGKGHVLLVEREDDEHESSQMEFDIEWSCSLGEIQWGDAWSKSADLEQLERIPAPRDMQLPHTPKSDLDRQIFDLACASVEERTQIRTFRVDVSPVTMTRRAWKLLDTGTPPHKALFEAAGIGEPPPTPE